MDLGYEERRELEVASYWAAAGFIDGSEGIRGDDVGEFYVDVKWKLTYPRTLHLSTCAIQIQYCEHIQDNQ